MSRYGTVSVSKASGRLTHAPGAGLHWSLGESTSDGPVTVKSRVLFISGREVGYIRNRVLLSALRRHFQVTLGTSTARSTPLRVVHGLLQFASRRPDYDICFVGFYGQPLGIALSYLQRRPILLDAYVSTYDTVCHDRRWVAARSLGGRVAYWLDRHSCRRAAHVITDTRANANYLVDTFGIPRSKVSTVYVGCDQALFYPRDERVAGDRPSEVFYYSSFLPLHGTDVIIEAAALLRHRSDIRFTIGGDGRGRKAAERRIQSLGLTNVELVGWIPLDELPQFINRASVCLGGHFSTIPKAARVISTKTFQFVAMRRATILGQNRATRELFDPGEHVYAVPMGDSEQLAEAICLLVDDDELRRHIAGGGYQVFQERLTTDALAREVAATVEKALCGSAS